MRPSYPHGRRLGTPDPGGHRRATALKACCALASDMSVFVMLVPVSDKRMRCTKRPLYSLGPQVGQAAYGGYAARGSGSSD